MKFAVRRQCQNMGAMRLRWGNSATRHSSATNWRSRLSNVRWSDQLGSFESMKMKVLEKGNPRLRNGCLKWQRTASRGLDVGGWCNYANSSSL